MKSPVKNLVRLPMSLIAVAVALTVLSGCQKDTIPETDAGSDIVAINAQNVPVTSHINQDSATANNESENKEETMVSTAPMTEPTEGTNFTPETIPISPQQPIKGKQVTDVHYRSDSGETLSVVFETSATGTLNAIITLADDNKITLSAPEGQGNNPTYHSADGTIELISHKGGAAMHLIRNDEMTSFEAISAEAEVITQI